LRLQRIIILKLKLHTPIFLDSISNRIGILKLEFNQDNTTQEYELKEFLTRLILVYFFYVFNCHHVGLFFYLATSLDLLRVSLIK
jgi:hypothetical protein